MEIDLRTLLQALSFPALLVSAEGRIVGANTLAENLLGGDFQNRHYVTALRQPAVVESVERCLQTNKKSSVRYLDRNVQGVVTYVAEIRPIELSVNTTGVLISFEDATVVEENLQIRRDFVANVSHELRTPLTAVLGFIDTLRGPAKHNAAAHERFLTMMSDEAQRMNRLIKDLLSLSKVEARQRVRPTGIIEIPEVLETVVGRLSDLAEQKGIEIRLSLGDRIPPVMGDLDELVQVFTNLIENALKYGSTETSAIIDVKVFSEPQNQVLRKPGVRIDVQDYGEGIDTLEIPRLTERFYRTDQHRSRELGGTGLGLSIVKHIVNRHRGRLKIESVMGKGSLFSVYLPATNNI